MSYLHVVDVDGIDCLQWGIHKFTVNSMLRYHKFMICKFYAKDYEIGIDGSFKLIPSVEIDNIWREHMLRPSLYYRYMEFLSKLNDEAHTKVQIIDYHPSLMRANLSESAAREKEAALNDTWSKGFGEHCTIHTSNHELQSSKKRMKISKDEQNDVSEVAPTGNLITISIEELTGKTCRYSVNDQIPCKELKEMICNRIGETKIRIIFAGQELKDERTLSSYSIQNESTLYVTLCLRGCSESDIITFIPNEEYPKSNNCNKFKLV